MSKDFKYLGKNGFPHGGNIDVYKYDNQIDYSRYDYTQMSIQVCSVPWEQGEAHIGERTLSGIGNVVHFGTEAKRNAWFDAIPDSECFRWDTKFKELHRDLELIVPLPFDIASNYNYVRVTYSLFANDSSPLQYESASGVRSWFYFIREAEFIAPNTTKLILLDDAWQTWIYKLDITNMILERGHAPMFATKADDYLAEPISNCQNLLSDDINFGELQRVKKVQATALNAGDMYAVIATSAMAWGEWGTKAANDWKTPAGSHNSYAGVPNVALIALDAGSLNSFLDTINDTAPQFKQTVQCVFFIAKEYVVVSDAFTFGGVSCYRVGGYNHVNKGVFSCTKADWGYADRYADIAKLYTYPYSALEITDERGNTEIVRIEDTSGKISMGIAANLVFPYLNLNAVLKGIGGGKGASISFQNMTEHTLSISGRWYEHLREWQIPGFAVILSASKEYDYSTHFDRIQMENDRTTAKGIATRNAEANKTSADATANTQKTNSRNIADAQYTAAATRADGALSAAKRQANAAKKCDNNTAQNIKDNAEAQTGANTSIVSEGNSAATDDANYVSSLAQAIQAWNAGLTRETANNEIEAKTASTTVGAAAGVVNSAASGAISGGLAGPGGAVAGAIGGLISGGISAAASVATNAIAVNALSSQAESIISNAQSGVDETSQSNTDRTKRANTARSRQKGYANTAISTSASNSASTMTENAKTTCTAAKNAASDIATASKSAADTVRDAEKKAANATNTTALANNTRTYEAANNNAKDTYDNAGKRIENLVNQAALRAPSVFGSVSNADYPVTRPLALFVNIVTESKYAIQRAGDEFLRYGYNLDKQWDFNGNWCIGENFTFWKLRDYWSTNQIPDRFADQIRFLLFGGITVWSDPSKIGQVSIYDNGI